MGKTHHHPHCGELLLRDRGWLWMVRVVSTLFVDSLVDDPWKAWIAPQPYPQPSTSAGHTIPQLPRMHPQSKRCPDNRSNLGIAEFKRPIVLRANVSHTYPQYPPALLL